MNSECVCVCVTLKRISLHHKNHFIFWKLSHVKHMMDNKHRQQLLWLWTKIYFKRYWDFSNAYSNEHTMQQQVNAQKAYHANSILSVYSNPFECWNGLINVQNNNPMRLFTILKTNLFLAFKRSQYYELNSYCLITNVIMEQVSESCISIQMK